MSIKQEFDALQDRGIEHVGLVRYYSMKQEIMENKIVVEVRVTSSDCSRGKGY